MNKLGVKKFKLGILISSILIILSNIAVNAQVSMPSLNISMSSANSPQEFSKGLQILIWMTVLTLAPSIFVMATAFIRIVIVLSLTRQAMGTASLPPSQVIVGLAMILTFFVMAPTFNEINTQSFQPYMNNKITQQVALKKGLEPLRKFMFKQTDESDLALFVQLSKIKKPRVTADIPTYVLLPSFIISELKTAFKIGFMIFIPFLIIDIVVSSILVSMGMLFLPPVMISMPFKIILFVLIDGWHLIAQSLIMGFR
ncbi:MAG: flagellar type III secretion system pore protein FliP [Candidatus Gastranaerophilales bacterium]|nr:flagellar type III secretion system pore protein FliP [Candidatus Gastranaerophilales bacterium]